MDSPSQPSTDNVANSLNNIHISDAQMQPLDGTPIESNPWKDQLGELSLVPMKPTELHGPDLSAIDKSIYVSPEPAPAPVPEPDRDANTEEVLNEFDPLSDRGEQAAREAWAHSKSHPPPSQPTPVSESEESILDSASPEPPPKDIPPVRGQPPSDSPRTSGSNFPSLASFTRSFSIPTIGRPRPISIDVAKPVPSLATLSSFAALQDQQPHDPENSSAVARSSTPGGNGTDTSPSGRERDKEPVFDFQKFLDQMKLKGADPVAKYLRSYVLLCYFVHELGSLSCGSDF
jgi:Rab5 GDP/GTP exchange factor